MWARTGLWVSTAICFCKCSSFPMISCLWWTPRNSLSITDGNKSNLHFLIDVLPLIMRSADPWRSLFGSSEGNLLFCLIAVHRKLFCWNMTAATRNSCCHSIKAAESSFLQCLVHGCQLDEQTPEQILQHHAPVPGSPNEFLSWDRKGIHNLSGIIKLKSVPEIITK